MKSIKSLLIPFALFVVFFAGVIGFQNRMIDRWHKEPKRFRDTLYLPSSDYVRVISLGYNQFTADFLWLRMIQVFAASWSAAENPSQIFNYSNVITDLDPRFNEPYSFAIMGIGEEGRNCAKLAESLKQPLDPFGSPYLKVNDVNKYVLDIINKALVRNPGHYKVPYDGAFFAYWSLNDPKMAKYYVRMAKQDPEYPDYIDRWEGYFELKQGRYLAAFEKYLTDYAAAIHNRNKDIYGINRMQLNRTLNTWLVDATKQRAVDWKKAHGGKLPTVDELRQAGAFKSFEYPDIRLVYGYVDGLLADDPNITRIDPSAFARSKQVLRTWDDLPPGPYDFVDPRFRGYLIWATQTDDSDRLVMPTLEALHVVQGFVNTAKADAAVQKQKTGKFPPFKPYFEDNITACDPFGKPWVYDETTGVLKCASVPDIEKLKLPNLFE